MLRPWRIHPARRRAIALVRPFVERTRLARKIPNSVWLDPYFVGFIGMLVTLAAARNPTVLHNDELAAVQSSAWAAITGMQREMIGDELCSLSADHDPRFEQGCINAANFLSVTQTTAPEPPLGAQHSIEERPADALWERYFIEALDDFVRSNV
jgi:hypothetical protein